jgi:acrylyl-CoA reductase (NADPH)/3-hydroxypropionyl-CoA dehydratase/3-hydroxypropionyl-CoA synthetase
MALLRDHLTGGDSLAEAMARHADYLATRENPLPWTMISSTIRAWHRPCAAARRRPRPLPGAHHRRHLPGRARGTGGGLKHEARLFAEAVCDPEPGPSASAHSSSAQRSPAVKYTEVLRMRMPSSARRLEADGACCPSTPPSTPASRPCRSTSTGWALPSAPRNGEPAHADPVDAEKLLVFPTPTPGPNEALVYVLASEMNFNDIWAITGIPVSPFDARDADVQVTGSGGVALVAQLGEELVREGRLSVGDLVTIYSGQSELLSPDQGLDPMAADFRIQGYERNDGSHASSWWCRVRSCIPKLGGLTIEEAGSYGLTLGTIHRALFTTLGIRPGRRLFVEGAATGTGLDALRTARQSGLAVVGMVSSEERGERVRGFGGAPLNRKDPRWADIFTPVPDDPPSLGRLGGRRCGLRRRGPRPGRRRYRLRGLPRRRKRLPALLPVARRRRRPHVLRRLLRLPFLLHGQGRRRGARRHVRTRGSAAGQDPAGGLRPGAEDGIVDRVAIEAIEVGCTLGAQVAVLADTAEQREFVNSLGFGARLRGVVSIDAIARRLGDDFDPPGAFPRCPIPSASPGVQGGGAALLGPHPQARRLRRGAAAAQHPGPPRPAGRGVRARGPRRPGLATSLVKPNVGKVVYAEDLSGRRLSFYAPQVWMRQRRILMPTAEIRGTHLNTAREFAEMQERIAAGMIDVIAAGDRSPHGDRRGTPGHVGKPPRRCELRRHARPAAPGPEDTRRAVPCLGHPRGRKARRNARPYRYWICRSTTMSDNENTRSVAGSRMDGKVVILTGAAGNIGTYISRSLLREGARLVMTGRNEDKLTAFIDELESEGFDRATWYPPPATAPIRGSAGRSSPRPWNTSAPSMS